MAPVEAGLLGGPLIIVGAVLSIAARWPHQFGGQGSRDNMLGDFVSSGTALAPPLFILVLFVAAAVLARRQDRWGTVAGLLVAVLAVGSLWERPRASRHRDRLIPIAGLWSPPVTR